MFLPPLCIINLGFESIKPLPSGEMLLLASTRQLLFSKNITYVAASGFNCSTQDLYCGAQTLSTCGAHGA